MVLAAGVSAFHTSAAAGLRWQQLLSLYKAPHAAHVLPYTQEQRPGNVLTGITGGVKLGQGGHAWVWCSAKLYFGKVPALPLRPLCCSAMGVIALSLWVLLQYLKKALPPLSFLSAPSHLSLSLPFSPPSRGQKGLDQPELICQEHAQEPGHPCSGLFLVLESTGGMETWAEGFWHAELTPITLGYRPCRATKSQRCPAALGVLLLPCSP